MASYPWKPEYSVNIRSIDAQHQKLVALINNFYTDLLNCPENAEKQACIGKTLEELVAYSNYHFAAEEKLMLEHQYPAYQQHKLEHESFKRKVAELMQTQNEAENALPFPVVVFLRDWLTTHVIQTDKEYGPYLRDRLAKA